MKIKGFIPAPFTPFSPEGLVNTSIIPRYAEFLKDEGIAGVFINGTTGEGLLLSVEERIQLAEAWIKHQTPDFHVIIHVGASSLTDALELTRHADSIHAYAFSTMAPMFLKPAQLSQLISYCEKIAGEAPNMPFYYYHIPQITQVDFMMIEFLEKAVGQIPNLTGIKYSGTNIMDVLLCAEFQNQGMDIIYGQDEKLLAGLAFGLEGAIGSTYNYIAPLYHELLQAYQSGEIAKARKFQHTSATLVRIMDQYGGGVRVGKRIMKEIGLDCGELRSPGISMNEREWEDFQSTLMKYGVERFTQKVMV